MVFDSVPVMCVRDPGNVAAPADANLTSEKLFLRFSTAVDYATRQWATDAEQGEWCVVRIARDRRPVVVWVAGRGDDDGEASLVPRRPPRPTGSGAIVLPLPDDTRPSW
jgi:hypothetical protein